MFVAYESYPYFRARDLDVKVAFELVLPLLRNMGLRK